MATTSSDRSIKELDNVNRRLEAANIRWETIFYAASDPIIIGDEEGILICNPRFEELTSLTSHQIVGVPISSLPMCISDKENCKNLMLHWKNPSNDGGRFTWQFSNSSGKEVFLDMQIRFVEIENYLFRFCIGRDITHEMKLLDDQKIAIAQIDKNMAQLAALNDEIRNPLTLISMSAGMEEGPCQDRILEGVSMINKLVDRLDRGFDESEKVRKFLQRTISGFMAESDGQ